MRGGGSLAGLATEHLLALGGLTPGDLALALAPALTLSALLSIDTLKTCVVLDGLTGSRHDSNREIRGQGVANLAACLVGGMPGAGTSGATLLNVASGGATLRSGLLAGAFALAAALLLPGLLGYLPIAALSGVLVVVAWRMLAGQPAACASAPLWTSGRSQRGRRGGRRRPVEASATGVKPLILLAVTTRFAAPSSTAAPRATRSSRASGACRSSSRSSCGAAPRPASTSWRATCSSAPPISCCVSWSRTSPRAAS
jgi:hypothetical protein